MEEVRPSMAFSCSGVSEPKPRPRLLDLVLADLLPALAQLHQQGHDVQRLAPGHELLDLALDDGLGRRRFLATLAKVGLGHGLQVVEVVDEDARHLGGVGIDVARHCDVDQEEGPVPPCRLGRLHVGARDHDPRGSRPADHDLGLAQLFAQGLEGSGSSAECRRQLRGPLEVAAPEDRGPGPAAHQVAGRQLAHLAGPHQEDVTVAQLAEDLLGELHRDERDRDRVVADARLRSRPLGGGHRSVPERVQDRPERGRGRGILVGRLHLAQDLRLTEDHRVEAGRDPEDVADRVLPLEPIEVRQDLGGGAAVVLRNESGDGIGGPRILPASVDLHPVAGREDDRLLETGVGPQPLERLGNPLARKGHGLAHRQRGGLVAEADDDDHG